MSKPVEERIPLAEANNACKLCLVVVHKVEECRRKFICPEAGCSGRHNKLLHIIFILQFQVLEYIFHETVL